MGAIDMFLADGNSTMVAVLVFLAAGTLAFSVMAVIRVQGSVKRRAATIGRVGEMDGAGGSRSLRHSSRKAAQRVIDYTTKHYNSGATEETKVLRRRMIMAGIYDEHAVAYFFLGRTVLAVVLAGLAFFFLPVEQGTAHHWLFTGVGGLVGYLGPSLYIDNRIKRASRSTSPASRTSWTCWWCAPMRGSAWRRRSIAWAASLAIPIRRSPPTSAWPASRSAPAAP